MKAWMESEDSVNGYKKPKKYLTDLLATYNDAQKWKFLCYQDNAVWEEISANELSHADKSAGVIQDIIVKLGSKSKQNDIREPVH